MKGFSAIILFITLWGCTKTDKPCESVQSEKIGFKIYEKVADTLLETDTAFQDHNILFKADKNYSNIKWKIGNDPRSFRESSVNLVFPNPESLEVKLTALETTPCKDRADTLVSKSFTVVLNDGSVISPIVGRYLGYEQGNEAHLFSVDLKFWFGGLYPWWPTGAYSIHNLPQGFHDSTQNFNGDLRPEIDGIVVSNGYKNVAFDMSGYIPAMGIKGVASLKRGILDSLIINYTVIDTVIYQQNGSISYLAKKFIGIRQ